MRKNEAKKVRRRKWGIKVRHKVTHKKRKKTQSQRCSSKNKKLTKSEHSGEAEKKCKNNMVARAEQILTKIQNGNGNGMAKDSQTFI